MTRALLHLAASGLLVAALVAFAAGGGLRGLLLYLAALERLLG